MAPVLVSEFSAFKELAMAFGVYRASRSSIVFSSYKFNVKHSCMVPSISSTTCREGLCRAAVRAYRSSSFLYVAASSGRSFLPERRYLQNNWVLYREKAVHPMVRYRTTYMDLTKSRAGKSGSNQTPHKFSILSFFYKLILGVAAAMYEFPSKLITFLKSETSTISEIEEDVDKGVEALEKVAKSVEQAALLVKEASNVVVEDARKTEEFLEKAQSTIKQLEKARDDDINTTYSQSNSKSKVVFEGKTTSSSI